ncbi:MAG: hypothetical protein HC828_17420, partial [Blastochloris sp.]|nr:hypothetical protein [Blastochloris sp.]
PTPSADRQKRPPPSRPELKTTRDLLIVGRASKLPIMSELNDLLPASFENGSDIATEKNSRVIYRVPPGTDLGYVQLIQSPWNPERAVLTVLGSSDQGLEWAGAALWKAGLRSKLLGSFAAVKDEQVTISDIQPNAVPAQATAAATADTPPQATVEASVSADGTPVAAAGQPVDVANQPTVVRDDSFPIMPLVLSLIGVVGVLGLFSFWRPFTRAVGVRGSRFLYI